MNPKSDLASILEPGVVAFTLRTQRVGALEGSAESVDGETGIVGDGDIPGAAAILLPIVPVFVIAGTGSGLGLSEWAAEFLAGTAIVGSFAILAHGEAGIAKEIADGQLCRVFGIPPVERDAGIALVDVVDNVVDDFDVIGFVGDKGAFPNRNDSTWRFEDVESDGGISDIGGSRQLVDGRPETQSTRMWFLYDNKKNLISVATLSTQKSAVEYDDADNLKSYRQPGVASTVKYAMDYGSTAAKRKEHLLRTNTTPMGTRDSYTYDDYGNCLTSTRQKSGTTPFMRTETTYDANGNYQIRSAG